VEQKEKLMAYKDVEDSDLAQDMDFCSDSVSRDFV